jgi:GTP cyclohydrolase I
MERGVRLEPQAADGPLQVDVVLAEEAVRTLLKAFGMEQHDEIIRNTPRRFVEAYRELFSPRAFRPTTFPNEERYDELVLVRGVQFRSVCEHHLLPFTGQAAVGYLPGEEVAGLSKLARVVELYAGRPQRQERLTVEIADWLDRSLRPRGVGVLMVAHHSCMALRGVTATESTTVTSAFRGTLKSDRQQRAEFLALVPHSPDGAGAWGRR